MVGGSWDEHGNVVEVTNDLRARRPPLGHLRIGEAENPGPAASAAPAAAAAAAEVPWSKERPQDSLAYPEPHRPGFRDFFTPGYEPDEVNDEEAAEMEAFQLVVETANTTSWGPLRKRLKATQAHIMLAQETKIMIGKQAEVSAWALRNGWKMVAAPAIKGKHGGASGGVAIFARSEMGVRFPVYGTHILEEGRAVAAIVEPPACRPVLAVSVYLRDGVGMSEANIDTMNKVGVCAQLHGEWQRIIGGDFNVTPQTLATAGHAQQMDARVVAPETRRGTCRTRWGARTYDFFVIGQALANGVQSVDIEEGTNIKTHAPVQVRFRPRLTSRKKLTIRRPEALGKGSVYGPLLPPPDWEETIARIESAVHKARWAERDEAQKALDDAYEVFSNLAERELEHITGVNIERLGDRGRKPSFAWRSVLPEKRPQGGDPTAATRGWIESVVREVGRLALGDEAPLADEEAGAVETERGADERQVTGRKRNGRGEPPQAQRRGKRKRRQQTGGDEEEDDMHSDEGDLLAHDMNSILDDVADSIIADFPAQVIDDTSLRLQNRTLDIVTEAKALDGATAEDKREFVSRYTALLNDARTAARESENQDTRLALAAWRDWIRDGAECGLRNAHKYTKVPEQWTPTTAGEDELDVLTCDPSVLLNDLRNKYIGKWAARDQPRRVEWVTREALPRMTAEEISEASGSFAWRTSATYDGFHPRHWSLLSTGARRATAALCEAIELLGALPVQINLVTMPLIGKALGGYRAIGMVAALLRLWARARRPIADAWEDRNRRSFWSADKGNSPLDTIWRQEARQEAAVADGLQGAALLYDLDSFYELIDRDLLLQRARRTGFPEVVVRVCLALYACPRMLSLDGALTREVYPERGIIAGDTMATTLVKVYCIGALDELCERLPPTVQLDAHIDDLVLTAEAGPREIMNDVPKAEALLMNTIENDLRCTISIAKAGLVATTHRLATELKKRIPTVSGPVVASMPNLGVDCRAAAPRGRKQTGTKRAARMKKGRVRAMRLHKLARVLGRRTKTIYAVGIAPAAYYGTAVQGLGDLDAKRARRMAVAALPPRTRLRSLATTLLLNQTPTWKEELGPSLQHSRMVWKAVTQPEQARMRRAGLTNLRDWYDRAAPGFAPLVKIGLEAAGRAAQLGEPEVNAAWKQVRGPIAASAMSLARIGWRYISAFEWEDDRGVTIQLTANTPAAIADLLRDGHRRSLERYLGRVKSVSDVSFANGRRACADMAEAYLKGPCPRGVTPQQRGAFRAAATGAVMTQARAVEMDYVTEDVCPLCGRCGDTVFHRVYDCECSKDEVEAVVPQWFLSEARRRGPSSTFYTSGIFPHPADLFPLPAMDQTIITRDADELYDNGDDDGMGYDHIGLGTRSGSIFVDGSASTSPIRGIARAGCTATEVDREGNLVREVNMLIPASVAQTAQAAEHGAILLAICQLQAESDIFTDCLGAQRAYSQDPRRAADAKRKHGATVLAANADPCKRNRVRSLQWVRAHRDIEGVTDTREAWLIKGNAMADEAAKRAAAAHPQPSAEARAELDFYLKRFRYVAMAIGAALVKFPPAQGDLARRPPPLVRGRRRRNGGAISGRRTATDGGARPAGAGAAAERCRRRGAAKPVQETGTLKRPEGIQQVGTACGPSKAAHLSCYASAAVGAACAEPTNWADNARNRTPAVAKHWRGWRRASTRGKRATRPRGRRLGGARCAARGPSMI